jgi:hypothetical protein
MYQQMPSTRTAKAGEYGNGDIDDTQVEMP